MSESAVIARIAGAVAVRAGVSVGIGDDAAVFSGSPTMVAAHDMLVAGVHFRPETRSWGDIGHTALAVNLSDLAAMGAEPVCALVGLALPANLPVMAVDDLYAAMELLAAEHGCTIAGGDTSAAATAMVGVTAIGRMPDGCAPVLRSGGRPGDLLIVTGDLGGSAAGLELLTHGHDSPQVEQLIARHRRPRPLVADGRALRQAGVSAMLDCSDGLALDATRLAEASGCRVVIDLDRVPVQEGVAQVAGALGVAAAMFAATGGEDYELIASVAPDRLGAVQAGLDRPAVVVGWLEDGAGSSFMAAGREVAISRRGWEHRV